MKKNGMFKWSSLLLCFTLLFNIMGSISAKASPEPMTFQAIVFEINQELEKILVIHQGDTLKNPGAGQGNYFGGYSKNPYLWVQVDDKTMNAQGQVLDLSTIKPGDRIEFQAHGLTMTSYPPQYHLQSLLNVKVLSSQNGTFPTLAMTGLKVIDFDALYSFIRTPKDATSDTPYHVFKYNGNVNSLKKGDIINVQFTGPQVAVDNLNLTYGTKIEITERGSDVDTLERRYDNFVISAINIQDNSFTVTNPNAQNPNAPYMQFRFTDKTMVINRTVDTATATSPGSSSINQLQVGNKVSIISNGLNIETTPFTSDANQITILPERKFSGSGSLPGGNPGPGYNPNLDIDTTTFKGVVFATDIDSAIGHHKVLIVQEGELFKLPGGNAGEYFGGYSENPYHWFTATDNVKDASGKPFDVKVLKPGDKVEFKVEKSPVAVTLLAGNPNNNQSSNTSSKGQNYALGPLTQINVLSTSNGSTNVESSVATGLKILKLDPINLFFTASDPAEPDTPKYVIRYEEGLGLFSVGDIVDVELMSNPASEINNLNVKTGRKALIKNRATVDNNLLRYFDNLIVSDIYPDGNLFKVTNPKAPDPNAPYMQFKFTNETMVSFNELGGGSTSISAPGQVKIDALKIGDRVNIRAKGLDTSTTPHMSNAIEISIIKDQAAAGSVPPSGSISAPAPHPSGSVVGSEANPGLQSTLLEFLKNMLSSAQSSNNPIVAMMSLLLAFMIAFMMTFLLKF